MAKPTCQLWLCEVGYHIRQSFPATFVFSGTVCVTLEVSETPTKAVAVVAQFVFKLLQVSLSPLPNMAQLGRPAIESNKSITVAGRSPGLERSGPTALQPRVDPLARKSIFSVVD